MALKTLVTCIAAVLCYGCGRANVSGPDDVRSFTSVQVVLIDSFSDETCTLTSSKIVRVGSYYNFLPYDSLRFSFSATRLSADVPFDEILLKIGPATCLRDSMVAMQKNVSLIVKVSDISKPAFCALTFRTSDPRTLIRLSDLRVVGWMSK